MKVCRGVKPLRRAQLAVPFLMGGMILAHLGLKARPARVTLFKT